ncbi:MAG: hypothetical protein NXI31_08970 [bacterium]|nr:hypothetical protein [bacterium]
MSESREELQRHADATVRELRNPSTSATEKKELVARLLAAKKKEVTADSMKKETGGWTSDGLHCQVDC